jgi:hypothetical protein
MWKFAEYKSFEIKISFWPATYEKYLMHQICYEGFLENSFESLLNFSMYVRYLEVCPLMLLIYSGTIIHKYISHKTDNEHLTCKFLGWDISFPYYSTITDKYLELKFYE